MQPLVAAIAERQRGHMLELVGRAYADLSLAKLAALLGCSRDEAAQGEAARVVVLSGTVLAGSPLCTRQLRS